MPDFFKPILWSYDISSLDPERLKKTIVLNSINYGNLEHLRWVVKRYGKNEVRRILKSVAESEVRPGVRKLATLLFDLKKFHHASRGA